METVTLDRFELVGPLGSGADYDVRAAVDRETGGPVVLKRPSPAGRAPPDARSHRGTLRPCVRSV